MVGENSEIYLSQIAKHALKMNITITDQILGDV